VRDRPRQGAGWIAWTEVGPVDVAPGVCARSPGVLCFRGAACGPVVEGDKRSDVPQGPPSASLLRKVELSYGRTVEHRRLVIGIRQSSIGKRPAARQRPRSSDAPVLLVAPPPGDRWSHEGKGEYGSNVVPHVPQAPGCEIPLQAAQKGPDARRRVMRRARRTSGTSQRARERANAADGPFSAAC